MLTPYSELFDDRTISFDVLALKIIKQATPLPDDFQQAPTGMMIFLMGPEMIGQIGNPFGQKSNLDLR